MWRKIAWHKFPFFAFGEATVILVSGEALDDARVEKVAEGLERCGEGSRFLGESNPGAK